MHKFIDGLVRCIWSAPHSESIQGLVLSTDAHGWVDVLVGLHGRSLLTALIVLNETENKVMCFKKDKEESLEVRE